MRLYDEEGKLNDNHWMFKAARWAGLHYKLLRWILLLLMSIIVGVILWSIVNS